MTREQKNDLAFGWGVAAIAFVIGASLAACCTGCGPDAFVVIGPVPDSSSDADASAAADARVDAVEDADASVEPDVRADVVGDVATDAPADAKPDVPPSCDPGDVAHAGKCFYLDGTGGTCAQGYTVSSESAIASVLGANANAFQGKSYRTIVSQNCCVWTSGATRNYGMASHCNLAGPFGAGEPIWNGNFCQGQTTMAPKAGQITLCERAL